MGTNFKKAVVPPKVNQVLHIWHKDAKKRLKQGSQVSPSDRDEMIPKNLSDRKSVSSGSEGVPMTSPETAAMEEGDAIRYKSSMSAVTIHQLSAIVNGMLPDNRLSVTSQSLSPM